MFKVNNKTPEWCHWYFCCSFWIYFTPCFSVSVVDFEQVNVNWEVSNIHRKLKLQESVTARLFFHQKKYLIQNMEVFGLCQSSQYILFQSQQWKHLNKLWNLFKFNNKDTRTKSFWCLHCQLWTYFTHFSGVSNFDFEQVNAGWQKHLYL